MAFKIDQHRFQNDLKSSTASERRFWPPEAAGGRLWARLGVHLGVISGSVLPPRARSPILAKNVPAPRREHDFQGPEGPKTSPTLTPRRLRKPPAVPCLLQERLGGLLDASWPRFWVPFGPRKGPQNPSKSDLDLEANLTLAQATTHTKTANWPPPTAPPDICRYIHTYTHAYTRT